ncbi:hypothetical protein ACSBR2_011114 [Camellia fascicularis]
MEKFIQLHLTVNIVGVAVNFIAAIPSGNTPLSAVQLLWVGLVTDTLGAFALATSDPPPGETIPSASALLPSKSVWRNVLVQVVYQTGILLMLHFKGKTILHVDDDGQATIDVIVFNTYVMFQIPMVCGGGGSHRRTAFGGDGDCNGSALSQQRQDEFPNGAFGIGGLSPDSR